MTTMLRLEINYKEKNWKKHKHMETKQYATKQPMEKSKRKSKNTWRQMKMETQWPKVHMTQEKQL